MVCFSVRFSGRLRRAHQAVFEEVVLAVLLEGRDFLTPNLIDGLSELFHYMEPVKNVQSLQGLLPDHIQIRPPHIAAHESKPGRAFFPEHLKELEQSVDLSLGSAPEKAPTASIQLIDHGEGLMSPENGDLVPSDLGDPLKGTMGQAIVHNELNGSQDTAQLVSKSWAVSFQESLRAHRARNTLYRVVMRSFPWAHGIHSV